MQRAYRLSGLLRGGVLALLISASALLASCGNDDASSYPPGWDYGGQTGSLMPVCGLTPASLGEGVPASAPGLVLRPDACTDARALDALTVRDASGQPIPFELERLPDGELLVIFPQGLTPGSYVVGVPQPGDEDAGVEPEPPGTGSDEEPMLQTVEVVESEPVPERFGEIVRVNGECGAVFELAPDADVLPYLGSLSVELEIDGGATQTLVTTGTLSLEGGVARIGVPEGELEQLADGEHELRITVQLAGESVPLETFLLTLSVPCGDEAASEPNGGFCAIVAPPGATLHRGLSVALCAGLALTLHALRKRRRPRR